MFVIVVYDISTKESSGQRRLRQVASACENYGTRVQNSVFECYISQKNWVELRHSLLTLVCFEEDSLIFYFLDEDQKKKIERYGSDCSLDNDSPLIF